MKWMLLVSILIVGCASAQENMTTESSDIETVHAVDPDEAWMDTLVVDFINNSGSIARPSDTPKLSWIYDRVEVTDTATYKVVRIGRSLESRYMTEAWLYIDKNKRTVYEYDVVSDSLALYK